MLPGAGRDLEGDGPSRGHQLEHRGKKIGRRVTSESEPISEQRDGPKGAVEERRMGAIASDAVDLPRGHSALRLRLPTQHLGREVESDPSGRRRADPGGEAEGTGADIDRPPGTRRVTAQESLPEFPEEVALGRSFVASPLAGDPVGVRPEEPASGRDWSGGRTSTRRGRPSEIRSRHVRGESARRYPFGLTGLTPLYREGVSRLGSGKMPYYECPKCGGGYVIDVPPSARPTCDRDGARLKRASDASYERNAREE